MRAAVRLQLLTGLPPDAVEVGQATASSRRGWLCSRARAQGLRCEEDRREAPRPRRPPLPLPVADVTLSPPLGTSSRILQSGLCPFSEGESGRL